MCMGWTWLRGREKDGNAVDGHGNDGNDHENDSNEHRTCADGNEDDNGSPTARTSRCAE